MTAKQAFNGADVNRAIAVVKRSGLHIGRIAFEPDGKFVIFTDGSEPVYDWRKGSKLYEA